MDWLTEIKDRAALVRHYPDSMREIPHKEYGPIAGRSFFPGGSGLLRLHGDAARKPDIVVIGNDFGTFDEDYLGAVRAGEESLAGTWSGLIDVLSRAGVELSRCFFTNAVMGARAMPPNRGPSPGLKDREFIGRCARFLYEQINVIQPVGVVMLGKEQASVVAAAMPELSLLARCTTWRTIDDAEVQYRDQVEVPCGVTARFCAIMHPCLRASNMAQHGRRFLEYRNDAAELEMLRRVVAPRA